MKILTVDDSRTIRILVRRHLQAMGAQVLEACDGQQGLEAAIQEKPDLIILDVTMPIMDGLEALKAIRANPETESIPVLMLTAESRKEMVLSLIELGISDYIVKPFNGEQLTEKVTAILYDEEEGEGEEEGSKEEKTPSILIVDDKQNVLQAAQGFLQGDNRVQVTPNPLDAVELADRCRADIVFLDLVIPGHNVFEIFSMMRAAPGLKNTRFVAMAIRTMQEEASRARRAGFHDILIKPFSEKTILNAVRANLAGNQNLLSYESGFASFRFPPFSEHAMTAGSFAQQVLRKAKEAIHEIADSGYDRLLLDLAEIEQPDMSYVSCIKSIQEATQDLGLEMRVLAPNNGLARLLRQFDETRTAAVYSSMEEAVAAFESA